MIRLYSLMILFLFSINSIAQVAYRIQEGEPSPITGVVITDDKAKELYKQEQMNITLKDLRIKDKELSDHYKGQLDLSKQKLLEAKREAFMDKLIYFGLGVITTSLILKVTR